jgi:thiamine-phosphate pyrophosphorylase
VPSLPAAPFLYPIVDAALLGGRPLDVSVGALARGGAALVQLRAKQLADDELARAAREAVAAARRAGVLLLVNDRLDVARIAGADGVHLGQRDLRPSDARRVLGGDAVVGLSTHTLEQVDAAAGEPVDYVAFGPVFPTRTKSDPDAVVGLELLRQARARCRRPLVAIGGITLANAAAVAAAGADGAAVISALLSAADLEAAARAFVAVLRGRPD